MEVSIEEAKVILTELCEAARAGLEVVITRDGQPYMRLSPCEAVASTRKKGQASRSELRNRIKFGSFKPIPGWEEPLTSLFDSELTGQSG